VRRQSSGAVVAPVAADGPDLADLRVRGGIALGTRGELEDVDPWLCPEVEARLSRLAPLREAGSHNVHLDTLRRSSRTFAMSGMVNVRLDQPRHVEMHVARSRCGRVAAG
jgi:hypothetical protein